MYDYTGKLDLPGIVLGFALMVSGVSFKLGSFTKSIPDVDMITGIIFGMAIFTIFGDIISKYIITNETKDKEPIRCDAP
jgi:hypothetical protein